MIYQAIILIYECNDIKYFKLIRTTFMNIKIDDNAKCCIYRCDILI